MRHFDFGGFEREGVGQRGHEGVGLGATVDGIDHVAAVGAQHAALVGHAHVGDFFARPVHRPAGIAAKPAVLAHAANGADIVVALAHFGDEFADLFGRVLQIGVEGDDDRRAGVLEAREDGHVLTVVAVEQHHAGDIRAQTLLRGQQRGRAVAAAVVDEQNFVGLVQRIESGVEAGEQRGESGLFVVDGNDHRNGGVSMQSHRPNCRSTASRASVTRVTSLSCIPGKSGRVRMEAPTVSACGKPPGWKPRLRYRLNRWMGG